MSIYSGRISTNSGNMLVKVIFMKHVLVDVGDRIKMLRTRFGLNQSQLAKELGVSRSIISAYEKDIRTPSIEVFLKMCDIFNVPIEYFLRSEPERFRHISLDLAQLTAEQIQIIFQLIDEFKKSNIKKNNED